MEEKMTRNILVNPIGRPLPPVSFGDTVAKAP